jgi:Bacterial toxin 5
MIQSAWENQVQNISVEHPRVGGGVLDNPAIEVGGLPVAKSTVTWWENEGLLPAGTAARAPVIQ